MPIVKKFANDVKKVYVGKNGVAELVYDSIIKAVSFADGTDEEIVAMLNAHYNDEIDISDYWSVGDTRKIHLNSMQAPSPQDPSNTWSAQDITIVIVAMNHTDLETPINGHTKSAITVQTREGMNNCRTSNDSVNHIHINGANAYTTSFTKWANLYIRTYLNSTVLGAIPSGNFKSAIKPSKHYRHTAYDTSASELVTDTLFLPSYPEIYGIETFGYYAPTNPVEGTQFEYYRLPFNRAKYGNNNGVSNGIAQSWWTGSASNYYTSSQGYRWGIALYNSGGPSTVAGSSRCSLAPAWAM